MPLRSERTELSGGTTAIGMRVDVEVEVEEETFESDSVEVKFRAERGILSCTRL
jgi:hypothetical protein